VIKFQMQN